tara:strand:+ start:18623 stop:18934 length:312 start_codon:yes stop_codon:yes gene_type:complete
MITDIIVNNKYVLIYDGIELKSGTLTTGQVSSPFDVEIFDTAQEVIDRGIILNLTCNTEYLISSMEHGATLPADILAYLLGYVWGTDIGYQERMIELGYIKPE